MISSSDLFNHCHIIFSVSELETSLWASVANYIVSIYLKFLVHWQHGQASSCHLHRQYSINEGPIIPHPKSVTVMGQQEKIMAWEFWNRPGFHLHQLLSCAHPREQNHAVLQHQSAETCNNDIQLLPSGKAFCTKDISVEKHTFSNPRPCVNGALPVAINAASTCRIEETTDCKPFIKYARTIYKLFITNIFRLLYRAYAYKLLKGWKRRVNEREDA